MKHSFTAALAVVAVTACAMAPASARRRPDCDRACLEGWVERDVTGL